MDAEAEGEVAVGVAEEVEVVGIIEHRFVAVGGGEDGVARISHRGDEKAAAPCY